MSAKSLTLSFTVGKVTYAQYCRKAMYAQCCLSDSIRIPHLSVDVAKLRPMAKNNQVWDAETSLVE